LLVGLKGTRPRVEQLLAVPTLGVVERELRDEPPCLGRIVVLDRSLEVLAERGRLAELPPQPA